MYEIDFLTVKHSDTLTFRDAIKAAQNGHFVRCERWSDDMMFMRYARYNKEDRGFYSGSSRMECIELYWIFRSSGEPRVISWDYDPKDMVAGWMICDELKTERDNFVFPEFHYPNGNSPLRNCPCKNEKCR